MEDLIQGIILGVSGSSIWLMTAKDRRVQLGGCIIALLGQPFWLYTTWVNDQWGMFVLALIFVLSFAKGIWIRWPGKQKGMTSADVVKTMLRELYPDDQAVEKIATPEDVHKFVQEKVADIKRIWPEEENDE